HSSPCRHDEECHRSIKGAQMIDRHDVGAAGWKIMCAHEISPPRNGDHEADNSPNQFIKAIRGSFWSGVRALCGRHGRPSACKTKWSTGPANDAELAEMSRTSPAAMPAPIDCLRYPITCA